MYQVCTVRKSIVFVSTEQERAVANTKVTGRALVVDPGSIIPVGDANTKEFHFVNTGQGIRACSAETVLSKEVKYRRRAYADYCPLKGYPSSWWMLALLIISWGCTSLFVLYPNNSLRPLAFPSTTLIMFLLSDEIGFLGWAIAGDYVSKLTGLFWYNRDETVLRVNGFILHDIRPRFDLTIRLKLFMKILPLAWTLLLLWAGWTNILPKSQPVAYQISNWIHFGFGVFFTASLPFVWPLYGDMLQRETNPSTVMAFTGRTVPDIVAPRRFHRWSDSLGQFNIFPTSDGIIVFPPNARFIERD